MVESTPETTVVTPTPSSTPTRQPTPTRTPTETPDPRAGEIIEQKKGLVLDANAVRWEFGISSPATVSVEFQTQTDYPVGVYTMPYSETKKVGDEGLDALDYIEALSFPDATSGSGEADLQPMEYSFWIDNGLDATDRPGGDDLVIDFTVKYV